MAKIFSNINTSIKSMITNMGGSTSRSALTTAQFLSHVEDKNPAIRYTKTTDDRGRQAELTCCAVCLCEFAEGENVRNLECKHVFHNSCLDEWLQQCKSTCPLCRNKVLPDDLLAKYRRLKQNENDRVRDRINQETVLLVSSLRGNNGYLGFW